MYTGETMNELAELVDRAVGERLRIFVLQNSEGRVANVDAIKCLPCVAEARNGRLAALESDYRWTQVGES